MSHEDTQKEARRRAEMILKVRAGQITAAEAAKQLGVSRKTYYKWEQRGLAALLEGLSERNPGRPAAEPDPDAQRLQQRIRELEQELQRRNQREELRRELRGDTGKKE